MSLPKSVSVGGLKFKVITDKTKIDDEFFGYFSLEKKEIKVSPDQPMADQWSTLYHEMCHAATHVSGLSYGHSSKDEERLVRMLENILLPAFKRVHLLELEEE